MANDLNLCQFIGRLGSDPEIRYLSDGSPVANLRLAVGWKTKNGEGCEWITVVFFGNIADVVGTYLKKGSRIYVSGRFRTRQWDKDGVTMYTTEIVAREMQMLDSRNADGGQQAAPQQQQRPAQQGQPQPQPQQPAGGFDDFDDDIPF